MAPTVVEDDRGERGTGRAGLGDAGQSAGRARDPLRGSAVLAARPGRRRDVDCLPLAEELLDQLLAGLGSSAQDLDPDLPPAVGFAGNRHPVLVTGDLHRLATLLRLRRAHQTG